MVYQLFDIGKNSGAIAILLLLTTNTLAASSTEYVFTAPPEVNRQIVEKIPARDTEYPLHECNTETTESDDVVDSHNCECTDCKEKIEESQSDRHQPQKLKLSNHK
ncbi:MAG: hypothetical protein HC939_01540 [Pleurocapsa sp. SU_5_0]|nr:hypothetical protein [Pleurocapsa sp. SU_5_0]NJO98973.1 hypothetical protein [Pleurocapsa sp. CRU_1_2]NJR44665.1 hypothetical protein [Hyellaceae cyanobacterium CSU_1_1]